MKSKTNFKLLIALTSTIALVACNSGGASGGDTPPGPGPSPTPTPPVTQLQPLNLSSIGTPLNLNKVGGNSTWYMLVNNPNSTPIYLGFVQGVTSIFAESNLSDQTIIHPTQNVESYNGEVAGYSNTPDCLSLLQYPSGPGVNKVGTLNLAGNQSCVYKFHAFWNSNLNMPTTTQFTLDYSFHPQGDSSAENTYCTSGIGNCKNVIPYDSRNTLSYQSYTLKSQDNVESQLAFVWLQTSFVASTIFTYSGNKIFGWTQSNPLAPQPDQITTTVYSYDLNYNSTTNTLTKSNLTNFTGFGTYQTYNFNFTNGGWVSQQGDNFGALFWLNTTATGNQYSVTGTNGSQMLVTMPVTGSFQLLTSPNGNFASGYTNVGYLPNNNYLLQGWDETNNIILLNDGIPGGLSYCYNLNNQQIKTFNYSNNGVDLYMPLATNELVGIKTYDNSLYLSNSGFNYLGQNGQYSYNNSQVNAYKIDTINCTLEKNSVMPFANFKKNNNYGLINYFVTPDAIYSTQFVVSNANMK